MNLSIHNLIDLVKKFSMISYFFYLTSYFYPNHKSMNQIFLTNRKFITSISTDEIVQSKRELTFTVFQSTFKIPSTSIIFQQRHFQHANNLFCKMKLMYAWKQVRNE